MGLGWGRELYMVIELIGTEFGVKTELRCTMII